MRREEIIVTITPDGRATIAVRGIGGPHCEELTAELEKALGILREKHRTGEYYQAQQEESTSIERVPAG